MHIIWKALRCESKIPHFS